MKGNKEIFGFAPYWNIDKLENTNFNLLTTLAYFGVPVNSNGTLAQDDQGYIIFQSKKATSIFQKAHTHGTRVVLTLTQMDNWTIEQFLDNPYAQSLAIYQATQAVEKRGIDGLNIDFEYTGNPGQAYRDAFTIFIKNITQKMHQKTPESKVTVSVYASAVRDFQLYDIAKLSVASDGIFMMAYDFAIAGSDTAMPTSPLYGYKNGKYWYDVSTAVDDFLSVMPAKKLILGLPWYGYNYLVYEPKVNTETLPYYSWKGTPTAQAYTFAKNNIYPSMPDVDNYIKGWDNDGKTSWIAYHITDTDTWRMLFLDDARSLSIKYTFVNNKKLGGVGMWALGFDEGTTELWTLLEKKFGYKTFADSRVINKTIKEDFN